MNVNRGVGASFFKVALIAVVMSLFAVSCGGGEDDVQAESRVKNAGGDLFRENSDPSSRDIIPDTLRTIRAPEASGASNGLSKADCDDLLKRQIGGGGDDDLKEQLLVVQWIWSGLDWVGDIHEDDLISDMRGRLAVDEYGRFIDDDFRFDRYPDSDRLGSRGMVKLIDSLDDLAHTLDALDAVDRCAAASESWPDSVTTATTTTTVPAGDDDLTASTSVCVEDGEGVKRPFEVAVEQFREDLALFRVAQTGRNDQSLTEEQRQGHRANYSSAYDVKTKSAAAAIQVANERGFNLNSPDNLDERFLRRWDSTICE